MSNSLRQNSADADAPGCNPNSSQAPTGLQSPSRDDSHQTASRLHDEEFATPLPGRHADNQGESEFDRALRRARVEAFMAEQQTAELRMARSNLGIDQAPLGSQSPSGDDSYQVALQLFFEELAALPSSGEPDLDMVRDSQLREIQSAEQRAKQEEADHRMAVSSKRAMDSDAEFLAEAAPSDEETVNADAELHGEATPADGEATPADGEEVAELIGVAAHPDDGTVPYTSPSTAVNGTQRWLFSTTPGQVARATQDDYSPTPTAPREAFQMGSLPPPNPGRYLNRRGDWRPVRRRPAPAVGSSAGRTPAPDTAARGTAGSRKRPVRMLNGLLTAPHPKRPAVGVECTACGDERLRLETILTPCGHHYCRKCIRDLFRHATRNETSWPPRCCEPIPLASAQHLLDKKTLANFEARRQEWDVPPEKRIYCSNADCAAFIPTPAAATVAVCMRCPEETCTNCKKRYHKGECNNTSDQDLEQLRRTAQENGWQECQSCHNLVEQNFGCYHMTCRCKHQFCYLCNTEWKNCDCRRWNEGLLLDQQRDRGVAAVQEDLCTHRWQHEPWPDVCDLCGDRMTQYIMECPDCRTRYCLWCTQGVGRLRHRHRRKI